MKRNCLAFLALALAALACNLPAAKPAAPGGVEATFTAVAATLSAQMTAQATALPPSPTIVPLPDTSTPLPPTLPPTQGPTATPSPLPCNLASFVQDVTFPDGAIVQTAAAFTKTWRLKNVGTCTWTNSYSLVFESGDQMSGPASQALTSGAVAPGQTVDISVNLIAPPSAGKYRGNWKLREPGGVLFGLSTGPFWVDIQAVPPSPTPTSSPTTVSGSSGVYNAPLVTAESGSLRSNGSKLSVTNLGDLDDNNSSQAFLSFDISGLPLGAHLTEVRINFSNYDMLGDPFGSLGCMRIYQQDYGTLDTGDYFNDSPLGALVRWCSSTELSTESAAGDMLSALQAKVGSTRFQVRAQFNEKASDNDNLADMVRLGAAIKLIIKYTLP